MKICPSSARFRASLAIQLEIEDEKLKEWRERFAEIKVRSRKD
jgi:hypothetical protein